MCLPVIRFADSAQGWPDCAVSGMQTSMRWVSAQFWGFEGATSSGTSHLEHPTFAEKASNFALGCIVWLSLVVAFALSASFLVFV